MGVFVSPGVYSVEKDFALYAPALSTSIFGVVSTASKGPLNVPTLITDEGTLVSTFGVPSALHFGIYAGLRYLRKGRQLLFVRVANYDVSAKVDVEGATGAAGTLTAETSGTWGNNLSVVIEASTYYSGNYKFTVKDGGIAVEVWDDLSFGTLTDSRYWATIINGAPGIPGSDYIVVSDVDDAEVVITEGTVVLVDGDDGAPANVADFVGLPGTPPTTTATGLELFTDPDQVDVNMLAAPGQSDTAVVGKLLAICESRGDTIALIDPPKGKTVQGVAAWHNGTGGGAGEPTAGLNSTYGGLFWPWLKVYDGFNDTEVWIPPSGHVAGVMAFTDVIADPWWAPAGLNRAILSDVLAVEYSASQGERDFLYGGTNAVNPIVAFTGQGVVVWGQKTLGRLTTVLNRINVRRMMLFLRKIVSTATRTLLFEPNDAFTWRQFVRLVTPTMQGLKSSRAIYNYQVICDSTTNTQEVIDRNEMRGKILLQPTKTAEVIVVEFTLLPSGASFNEIA